MPSREELSAAGRKGAASKWAGMTAEQRKEATRAALAGRRSAAERINDLAAEVADLRALVEDLHRDRVAVAA